MRLNIHATTWIAILALAALLMSGFATSSTMMNGVMSTNGLTVTQPACQSHKIISSHHKDTEMNDSLDIKGQCEINADIVHDCCDSTCATSVAILIMPNISVTVDTTLALYSSTISGEVIQHTKSLYRPPIA